MSKLDLKIVSCIFCLVGYSWVATFLLTLVDMDISHSNYGLPIFLTIILGCGISMYIGIQLFNLIDRKIQAFKERRYKIS
jgi:hypothetical protein